MQYSTLPAGSVNKLNILLQINNKSKKQFKFFKNIPPKKFK